MPPAGVSVLVGVGSSAITLLITLYVKDSARKVVEEAMVKAQVELKKDIDAALLKFREDFIKALDLTYRRAAECSLMMEQPADRLDLIDHRLNAHEITVRELLSKMSNNNKAV